MAAPSVDQKLPAGSGTVELRLWVRLLACAKLGEKQLRRLFEANFDSTLPRFDVMAVLYRAPEGLRMSELSKALLVSNGNVTVVVRQLQERGHVKSEANPKDGRSAIVSLTPSGRKRFLELAEAHHALISDLFVDVGAGDKETLAAALGTLRSVMNARR